MRRTQIWKCMKPKPIYLPLICQTVKLSSKVLLFANLLLYYYYYYYSQQQSCRQHKISRQSLFCTFSNTSLTLPIYLVQRLSANPGAPMLSNCSGTNRILSDPQHGLVFAMSCNNYNNTPDLSPPCFHILHLFVASICRC